MKLWFMSESTLFIFLYKSFYTKAVLGGSLIMVNPVGKCRD